MTDAKARTQVQLSDPEQPAATAPVSSKDKPKPAKAELKAAAPKLKKSA